MSSYWDVIADAAAHWPLQETSGSSGADLAGANPAALVVGFDFAMGSVAGPGGWLPRGLRFDGATQLANIPAQTTLGLGEEHAYSLWWKPDAPPPWSPQVLVETGGATHGSLVYLVDGDVVFVSTRNYVATPVSASSPVWGSWRHLVAVHKPTSLEVYLDGELAGVAAAPEPWVQGGNTTGAIGAVDGGRWMTGYLDSGQARHFNGAIAGVALFDRALTAAEAAELYHGPEPTTLSAPTLAGPLRAGSFAAVTTGVWESHANGSLAVAGAVQLSPDAVSGWVDAAAVTGAGSYAVPLGSAGRWARVAAIATNLGGVSAPAYSAAMEVLPARAPAVAVAQCVAKSGAEAGDACPTAGAQAGLVLGGLKP
ncbi:LamG-like jellyroll fold domain-containing protein [Botrimarina mediterranea]|uniref:LamG-like jellyroll fold domain-containing protein n=1 Tax=Botrimarina mediterranea TaxID=2528022 RepID=A0A518KEA6_9BACT|nr:LamG-like jellyroll fold domain-containing protein [Botrimarina mediterranea]QDV76118.1 hypothetical protein Spa11_43430 [Botrimarina mediterranea]QDV80716.1 hypothetical protein K2D_43460 [Planctomycetes bacterium K2D]